MTVLAVVYAAVSGFVAGVALTEMRSADRREWLLIVTAILLWPPYFVVWSVLQVRHRRGIRRVEREYGYYEEYGYYDDDL